MLILNFSHPLTEEQIDQISSICRCSELQVIDIPVQLDQSAGFDTQVDSLLTATGLAAKDWQTESLIVNLPGLSPAAAVLLAKIHGLCGHFPAILRLRPIPNSVPTRYEVAEIVDLQSTRDSSRAQRLEKK